MKSRVLFVLSLLLLFCACHRVTFPINVNTASERDLEHLPDVGPKTAAAIVAGRPFKSVDDLLRVKGIGPKTLEKIRSKVSTVSKP